MGPIAYITKDIAFLYNDKWHFGAGPGIGFQLNENDRIGSRLLFTFNIFLGYRFTEKFGMEIYTRHFSNGSTTPNNYSYGFYGLGATYNF